MPEKSKAKYKSKLTNRTDFSRTVLIFYHFIEQKSVRTSCPQKTLTELLIHYGNNRAAQSSEIARAGLKTMENRRRF